MKNGKHENDIKQLNSFLKGEISAVETYAQAMEKAESSRVQTILRENRASHAARADLLKGEIRRLGGSPVESSGAWGAFARAVEGGAKIFGETAAVAALEEGEDHGLKDYQSDFKDVSFETKQVVANKLLPEQRRTHDALSALKDIMS